MILRIVLLVSLMVFTTITLAQDDYEAIAMEANRLAPMQVAKYSDDAKRAYLQSQQKNMANSEEGGYLQKQYAAKYATSNGQQKSFNSVMVFISFSMPRQSIVAYLRDAKTAHASVVIRGLSNNSFKDTFKVISELVKEANGGGVELNPIAFKSFHINKVPAVVVVAPANPCLQQNNCKADQDYDVIAGNITLQAALKEMRDHGKVAVKEVDNAISLLNGGAHV